MDMINGHPYDDDPERWAKTDQPLDPNVVRWENLAAHTSDSAARVAEGRNPGFRGATVHQLGHQQILDASGITADDRWLYERVPGMRMWRVELWKEA